MFYLYGNMSFQYLFKSWLKQYLVKLALGVSDFNLRIALQTLLKEYCEVCKSPKENKFCSFLQTSKVRPRKKARKYLYAVGENLLKGDANNLFFRIKTFNILLLFYTSEYASVSNRHI